MRDREQRLRWIEKLISGNEQDLRRSNALVILTESGNMAIAFTSIEEVVPASEIRSLAFLPHEFSGVLPRDENKAKDFVGKLFKQAPVLDTGGAADEESSYIVIVRSGDNLLGLRFVGTPYVVNLDETKHAPLKTRFPQGFDAETLPVLDIDAIVGTLLAAR